MNLANIDNTFFALCPKCHGLKNFYKISRKIKGKPIIKFKCEICLAKGLHPIPIREFYEGVKNEEKKL